MANQSRRARVHFGRKGTKYVVERIEYQNARRNGWMSSNRPGSATYPSIRDMKVVETPSLVDSGFDRVSYVAV